MNLISISFFWKNATNFHSDIWKQSEKSPENQSPPPPVSSVGDLNTQILYYNTIQYAVVFFF